MAAPLSSAYIAGDPRALAFLAPWFRDEAARTARARSLGARPIAPGLALVITAQNRAFPPSAARDRNLAALATPGTVVAVTGQQMGLFLGPLFTLYKTASTIAAARAIERDSGVRCVPLFWMQTEDHDFEEINHCHVHRPGAPPLRLAVRDAASDALGEPGARVSVEHRRLGDDVIAALDALDEALGGLPHAADFLPLLRQHYAPGRTLGAAFAGVMAALFADEGLVLFDSRDARAARYAQPIFARAITDCDAIADTLLERGRALGAAGFDTQVHVRPASPLCFFHDEGAEGPRYRLERRGADFALVGTDRTISPEALLAAVEQDPLCASSSALLRPIVQDALLPVAAYIGGAAEVSYFGQIAPLYPRFGLPPPLMVPRARFRILDDRARALLSELGLSPAEVELGRDGVLALLESRAPSPHPPAEALAESLTAPLHARLAALEPDLRALDPNLLDPARKTRDTVDAAVARFVERYRRALVEGDRVRSDRVDRLGRFLWPDGAPQERYHSLPYFACRFGLAALKSALFAALDPWDPTLRDLEP